MKLLKRLNDRRSRALLTLRMFLYLFLLLQVQSQDKAVLKAGAELQVSVSFLPEILAEFRGEKILAKDFLPTVAAQLNLLAEEEGNEESIRRRVTALIHQKYDKIISLELARLAGVEPGLGLASLDLEEKMKSPADKKALLQELRENGIAFKDAIPYIAESKAIDKWFWQKILPTCSVNEAECLVYYSDHIEKFKTTKRVRFLQVFTGYLLAEHQQAAKDKILKADHELTLGKDFKDVARRYSEDKFAVHGGFDEKFYTKGELREELQQVFRLKAGERTRVISSSSGFHILKVLEVREGGTPTFAEVKKGLMLTMTMEKARSKRRQMIADRKRELGFRILCDQ